MSYTQEAVAYFSELQSRAQRKLNDVILAAPIRELDDLLTQLEAVARQPVQLVVDRSLADQRRRQEEVRNRDIEARIGAFRGYLSQFSQFQFSADARPLEGQEDTIEFRIQNYDARLWVSESGGLIRIWPQWGSDSGFRRIDRLHPYETVAYSVPVSGVVQDFPKIEAELVQIFDQLAAYVGSNVHNTEFSPQRFVTPQFSVGGRGS